MFIKLAYCDERMKSCDMKRYPMNRYSIKRHSIKRHSIKRQSINRFSMTKNHRSFKQVKQFSFQKTLNSGFILIHVLLLNTLILTIILFSLPVFRSKIYSYQLLKEYYDTKITQIDSNRSENTEKSIDQEIRLFNKSERRH